MGTGAAHLPYLAVSVLKPLLMVSQAIEMACKWGGPGSYYHLGNPSNLPYAVGDSLLRAFLNVVIIAL